jgi:large subunit ribosomal protein L22
MEFISVQKYIISSPTKIREIAREVRKMEPGESVEKLPFMGKRGTYVLLKVIKSAIANAKQKGINAQDLVFKEIQINEGPRLKRFRAGSRGRAKPYKKLMSHIRVVLMEKEKKQLAETITNETNKDIKKVNTKIKKQKIKKLNIKK